MLECQDVDVHLLVHFQSGISRSTACMAAILSHTMTDADPDEVFIKLRKQRPQAWPNPLVIKYADEILDKKGSLLAAL